MADGTIIPRYCGRCGEIFDGRERVCPECGGAWPNELPTNLVACYALLLTEVQNLRRHGEITESMFRTMRRIYEERLVAVRPARKRAPTPVLQPAAARPMAPAAATPQPAAAFRPTRPQAMATVAAPTVHSPAPPRPPRPPSHVTRDLRNWAARRQADLVLYLGAFLLTISALIFVSYRREGLSGSTESALFAGYTLIFLVFGLQLRRWKRVMEAGPAFLAIAAVLTPLNFVALYTNVLADRDVPQEYVWLAGSLAAAVLYSLFALRGYGRLYWIPAGGAYFAAYASLGAAFQLPDEWFGPWFMALALVANLVAPRLPDAYRGYTEGGALTLGAASLLYSHEAVAFESGDHAILPVAYALATLGLVRSAFPSRRFAFLGLLPPAAVMTVASAAWSVDSWAGNVISWAPLAISAAAAGYVAVARAKRSLAREWATISFLLAGGAVALAHTMVLDEEFLWRLPVAYGAATLISVAWFIERRYFVALGLIPALSAATAATAFWAADTLAFEWLGSFVATAGLGYIVLARVRPAEHETWRGLAALAGVIALTVSHLAGFQPGIYRWELATAYGLVGAGAAFDALGFRPSAVVAIFAVAAGGAAALWAFEVGFAYWAAPALALAFTVVATEFLWAKDRQLRALAWPSAFILSASPAVLVQPFINDPWVGAANFGATSAVLFAMAWRTKGAFAALFGSTSARAARLERQMLARLGAWALFGAGGMVDLALDLSPVEAAWTFAVAGAAMWLSVAAFRHWLDSLDEVLAPVGLSAFVVALTLTSETFDHPALILGLAAVCAALATGGPFPMVWRGFYATASILGLISAHYHAADVGTDAWQLPVVYGAVLAALLWDSAWNRFQPAMLFVPAVTTFGAASVVWWREWPDQHMTWTPLALALALAATEALWKRGQVVGKGAWPYVIVLGLAPVTQFAAYDGEPWYGVAAFALAAAAWTAATIRSNGAITSLLSGPGYGSVTAERQILGAGAFGLGLVTLAYANQALEVSQLEAAWTAAGATWLAWAAIIALRRWLTSLEQVLGPASLSGIVVAIASAAPEHDHNAMILGITSVAAALTVSGPYKPAWRAAFVLAGLGSLAFAHTEAATAGTGAWQLPAAYGFVLAALLWDSAWNRFQPAMLVVPAVAATGATAFGWWQEWPEEHLAWAPLGIALAIAVAEPLWRRGQIVARGAWIYVLGLSLAPFALLQVYDEAIWAGFAAFALATLAWALTSWRSKGRVASLFGLEKAVSAHAEQQGLGVAAFGLGLVTLAQFNYANELSLAHAGWTYAAVGAAAILATCIPDSRVRDWLRPLTFSGSVAAAIGIACATDHLGEHAAMFALLAATFLASGLANRSEGRVSVAAVFAAVSAAFLWAWSEYPIWSLSLVYGGAAALLFVALAPARKSRAVMPAAVDFLSVAPILVATATSVLAVGLELDHRVADGLGRADIVRTAEWGALAINVALAGLLLFGEGLYRRNRALGVAGTAVVLAGAELGIAMLQIDNIQAYTSPAAVYLIGLGLAFRQSRPLFGHQMLMHEALFVLGALLLVLPPAEQSFEPGGGNWGSLVILEGFALLAVGLSLFQRWLAVSGVLTLVGVAGRFVFDNTANGNIPYWVMLGIAGLALLAVGVLMLLERDWWDRTKERIAHWWLEGEHLGPPGGAVTPHP